MKFNGLVPVLWVADIEQTIAFYRDVLGFECANQTDAWACLVKNDVEVMISLPNKHEPFDNWDSLARSTSKWMMSRICGNN